MLASLISTHTLESWLASYGYIVVFLLVMLESIGVPVPGETALIAAALYAGSTHHLAIEWVVAVAAAGAILGDNVGFMLGRHIGVRLLVRHGHRVRLNESRLRIGMWLFRHHGGKVVFWGRFVAILRTYAAFLAGANRMEWVRFLAFNAAGGIIWASVFGFGYYAFGDVLEHAGKAIDIALGVAGAIAVVGFVVWARRKEADLAERAERELGDAPLEA